MSMMILTQRMKTITIGDKVCQAISDWYFENGMPEPNWRVDKDPQWWLEYLNNLKDSE